MTGKYWAGVGSRSTPRALQPVMTSIAQRLAALGWTLRSGRATGADSFFEAGAGRFAELFVATGQNGVTPAGAPIIVPAGAVLARCELLASVVHPRWDLCNAHARLSHARNMCQVFGPELDVPVRVLIAWAPPLPDNAVDGGTGTAWRAAGWAGIRRYNLYHAEQMVAVQALLKRMGHRQLK